MTFEEEFPSVPVFTGEETKPNSELVFIEDVKLYCLDKQRVKEAIEKYLTCEHEQTHIAEDCEVCQLKKELGLE